MSHRGSIRRPLFVYAIVTSVACTAAVTTIASLTIAALLRSDRAAVLAELAQHTSGAHATAKAESVYLTVSTRQREGADTVAIRSSSTAVLYVRPRGPLTAPAVGLAIRRMVVLALSVAIACGLVSGWLTARLVLAPLRDLARATERDGAPPDLPTDTTMDEVHAVARAFRETLRTIRDEKALLEQRSVELASLQTQVARADRLASVGHLAAGVAHEIGNPLAAVMGYLHLLQRGLPADEQAEVVDRSARELQRIHGTIRKLLEFTRIAPGSAGTPRPLVLTAAIRETFALVRAHAALRDIAIELDASPDVSVYADERGLEQVLVNLLINAGQALAGRAGGRIRVSVAVADDAVSVIVDDSGPGIPPGQRADVFEPFFTTKASGDGTGLGLSVCRSLIEGMGGRIDLADSPLGGARFTVRLRHVTNSVT